jgi:hypothetical protein
MEPAAQLRLDRFHQIGRPLHQSGNRMGVLSRAVTSWSAGQTGFALLSTL